MKIGVRMRHAFFWSFAAHLFLLWLVVNELTKEADSASAGLAVTIAARPGKPPSAVPASTAAPPKVVPSPMLSKDKAAPQIQKPAVAEAMATSTPIATMGIASTTPNTAALDADGLRRYRFALVREMRRSWVYPPQALLQKWEGTTEIRIELFAGGRFAAARIEKSSGYPVLDNAALKIISDAATAAPVPTSLLGEAVSIVQAVIFSVPDANPAPMN